MSLYDVLVKHLGKFSSAPILFVGSGLSLRYFGLDNWEGLLKRFSEYTGKEYQYFKSNAGGDLSRCATGIADTFYDIWWNSEHFKDSRKINSTLCNNRESPLKIEVAKYILNSSNLSASYADELSEFKKIVVDAVITTNYDKLMEEIFPD